MKYRKEKMKYNKERLLLGGNNKKKNPFNVGDKLKQVWRLDDNNNPIKDGREMFEFVGMAGDLMLLKTLNTFATYSEDLVDPYIIRMLKESGHKRIIGDVLQLHYMYADRYGVVE